MNSSSTNCEFNVHYRREFVSGNVAIFDGTIDPCSLRAGIADDFWLLSTLTCLAEKPSSIKVGYIAIRWNGFEKWAHWLTTSSSCQSLFPQHNESCNQYGLYVVRMCVHGVWQDVIVDDLFPCYAVSDSAAGPVCAGSHKNDIWVRWTLQHCVIHLTYLSAGHASRKSVC